MKPDKPLKEQIPKCTYYYGVTKEQMAVVANESVRVYFKTRIKLAKSLLKQLVDKPFMEQDSTRIKDVSGAIKDNKELLADLE